MFTYGVQAYEMLVSDEVVNKFGLVTGEGHMDSHCIGIIV